VTLAMARLRRVALLVGMVLGALLGATTTTAAAAYYTYDPPTNAHVDIHEPEAAGTSAAQLGDAREGLPRHPRWPQAHLRPSPTHSLPQTRQTICSFERMRLGT
jgi:hypothetical protein